MAQPKRNQACPCGSGKKYKKCCWLRPAADEDHRFKLHVVRGITFPQLADLPPCPGEPGEPCGVSPGVFAPLPISSESQPSESDSADCS